MRSKKYRIPRKKKKQIPEGFYCYTQTSDFKKLKNGKYGYTIKECPFYYQKSEGIFGGWCKLIGGEIMDQCKSCGEKLGKFK
jgi:hypothetical protein